MSASFSADELAAGRAALLSGWSSGSEPGLVITRAAGALVWDSAGREYIDCTSMAWSNNLGASRPEVVEAAFAQARELSHLRSNFDSVPLLRLAHALASVPAPQLARRRRTGRQSPAAPRPSNASPSRTLELSQARYQALVEHSYDPRGVSQHSIQRYPRSPACVSAH